jgi:hypothetical protein
MCCQGKIPCLTLYLKAQEIDMAWFFQGRLYAGPELPIESIKWNDMIDEY